MATAETKPKKVRKTLGDVLLQSAKEQLRDSDTAERMRRLEEVAPPLTLPSPAPSASLPAPLPMTETPPDAEAASPPADATSEHPEASTSPAVPTALPSPDFFQPSDLPGPQISAPSERSVQHSDPRSDSHPDNRSDARTVERTAGQSGGQTLSRALGQSDDLSGERIDTRIVGHSGAQTNARTDDRTIGRSSVRSNDRSDTLSDLRSNLLTGARSVGHPSPAESLTAKQNAVLSFLLEHRPRIINCMTIAAHVGGSEDSVRSILTRLRKGGFLEYSKTKIGTMQGLSFRYNEPLCATVIDARTEVLFGARSDIASGALSENLSDARTANVSGALSRDGSNIRTDARSSVNSASQSGARSDWQPDWRSDTHHTDIKIERKNLSVSQARTPKELLLNLTDEDIAFFWPNLARVDFRRTQVVQIVEKLETLNTPMDDVRKSMDHADFELGAGPLKDAKGNLVADPRSYIFHALAKTGYYRRPPGYVSTQEQAELDAAEEARQLAKARAEREEAEFQTWRRGLDPETVQALLEGRRGPEEVWLRTKWREKRRAGEL